MSAPSREIVPSVGSIIRLIMRRVVVLPQPEGPTRTVIERSGMSKDSWSTATVPSGYRLVTESIRIKTPNTLRVWQNLPVLGHGRRPLGAESRPRVLRELGGIRLGMTGRGRY